MECWSVGVLHSMAKAVADYSTTPFLQHIIPLRLVLEQNLAQ
jgi:hypothetical protein